MSIVAEAEPAVATAVPIPETVILPMGEFPMGAADGDDKYVSRLEQPQHAVAFGRPFAIGRYPVTFAQWDAYVAANPAAHRPDDAGWGRGELPVFNVSWDDCQEYVRWLSGVTGRPFRLPTEAEWEYACRAGTTTVFSTGSRLTVDQANYLYTDFRGKPGPGRPLPVGSFPPNAFGLFDLHGNVAELVADAWHDSYAGAPTDGTAWTDAADGRWRVVRGGGWDGLPRILRSAFRDWIGRDQRYDNVGFRVACDV